MALDKRPGVLVSLAGLAIAPVGFTLTICYLYALWTDLKADSFIRFAADFLFFPLGIGHGIWLAVIHLL